ncbi:MAG: TaqI-like C-terminal specificity domain-containing protein, partial [Candidatus Hydrothermarchaeales archaeon]
KVTKEGIVLVDLDNYPNIKEYMNPHKTQLEKRKNWGETIVQAGKKWYEIWNPSPNMFKVKFITPDISTKNTFVLDENKEYICLDTCYALILKNSYSNLSKFILGLLNSSTLEFYFKHISPFVSGGYYRYKTQYLEKLPIKLPQTKKEEKLVSKITDKVNLILEKVNLEQKIEKFPQEYNKEYREQGVEFDSINITFNSDHKEIKIAVEKSLEGEFNLILGKKERPITVESEAKVEYIKEALEGKKAKKNEKLQFLIPRDDSIVNKILAKLKEDKKATQNPSVSELEEEINKLVYELYGLNKDDRKVIEEFLERF